MIKSIYEEAIELINLNILPRESGKTSKRKVIHALRQAQKQEKLLELYRQINNKRKELITLARHNTWSWKLDIEIKEIQDKLDELFREDDMNGFVD